MFRTYEPTRDRLIAVKVFRLDITPEQAQALALELSRAADAGLFHPSIVEPVAAGVEGTVAYRAEEYVAAESLDAAIRHYAPASLDKALPFITQLAGAIDFARAAGVGHGALHLRDVFVTPDEARASGFGVVEALERLGLRAPVRRPYSAPERIAGQPWGTAADVFSLAAIAFELLTGRRPSGTGDRIGAVTGENIGDHPHMIEGVLARAMDDDPGRRHPSALAFASALEAAARGNRVTGAMEQVGAITGMAGPAAAAAVFDDEDEPLVQDAAPGEDVEPVDVEIRRDEAGDAPAGEEIEFPIEEAAAALVVDPDAGEEFDDIESEREFDESPDLLPAEYELEKGPAARGRSLFDEDEAAEDLALDQPPADRFAAAGPATPAAAAIPTRTPRVNRVFSEADVEPEDLRPGTPAEPPRPAVLPLALTAILCLLVGFAAGYAVAGRPQAPAVDGETAAAGEPQPGAARDPGAGPQPSSPERTFSEQTVTPPVPAAETLPPGGREAAPAAPAPRTGRLIVRSTPSNAGVTVNGRWRGRTPLTLDALAFGAYAVRIVQTGYEVAQQDVRLSVDDPSGTVNVRLDRLPAAPAPRRPAAAPRPAPAAPEVFTGSIYIDSRPRGARVLVDGKPVGTTPMRLPEVSIGSHVVRLELEDHGAWTVSTRVAAGQEARVTGSLERIR